MVFRRITVPLGAQLDVYHWILILGSAYQTNQTMLREGVHSVTASTPELPLVIDSLVQIHASCILNDFTMATFVPPLSIEGMAESWRKLVDEAGGESRVIWCTCPESPVGPRTRRQGHHSLGLPGQCCLVQDKATTWRYQVSYHSPSLSVRQGLFAAWYRSCLCPPIIGAST